MSVLLDEMSNLEKFKPILPHKGQIIIEDIQDLVLCKPRLIPLKSFTLEKLEKMQQEVQKEQEQKDSKED